MVNRTLSAIGFLTSSISLVGEPSEYSHEVCGYGEILFSYDEHGVDHTGAGEAHVDDRLVLDAARSVSDVVLEKRGAYR